MTRIPTDPDQIRQLALVMAENGLLEVELADKDTKIRLVRASPFVGAGVQPSLPSSTPGLEYESRHAAQPAAADEASHPGAITSPMVGVAFLAPEPGAPNFVSVGDQVAAGQTLLLIEAMKTFNQIRATRSGTVKKIVVQNSTPVEYGELLMIVE